MPSIASRKESLFACALAYARDQNRASEDALLLASVKYAKTKAEQADKRDKWKARKRLGETYK